MAQRSAAAADVSKRAINVARAMTIGLRSWSFYPPDRKINLGLDLKGGVHLVLRVQLRVGGHTEALHVRHRDEPHAGPAQRAHDQHRRDGEQRVARTGYCSAGRQQHERREPRA